MKNILLALTQSVKFFFRIFPTRNEVVRLSWTELIALICFVSFLSGIASGVYVASFAILMNLLSSVCTLAIVAYIGSYIANRYVAHKVTEKEMANLEVVAFFAFSFFSTLAFAFPILDVPFFIASIYGLLTAQNGIARILGVTKGVAAYIIIAPMPLVILISFLVNYFVL